MASFINPDQKLIVIETNNLQFGSTGTKITTKLRLDESVVTTTPTLVATPVDAGIYTVAVLNNGTSSPELEVTLSSAYNAYTLGKRYTINLTANGNNDSLDIMFLFSQSYEPQAWVNSDSESNVGGYYTLEQIPVGAKVLSATLNTKFKSLFEYLTLLNFKIFDIYAKYKIKKNLPDIINSAIFAGVVPSNYTGAIVYKSNQALIDTIVLGDDANDADSYTKFTFNYVTKQKTITNNGVVPATNTNSNYQALDTIFIDRVTNQGGTVKKYRIATVTITRTSSTFTSIVDANYAITMFLVTGWTVAE